MSSDVQRYSSVEGVMVKDSRGAWIKNRVGEYIKAEPIEHVLDAYDALARQLEAVEHKYRENLWLVHGHSGMYGDDGEMQCNQAHGSFGFLDFKCDPLDKLEKALFESAVVTITKCEQLEHQLAEVQQRLAWFEARMITPEVIGEYKQRAEQAEARLAEVVAFVISCGHSPACVGVERAECICGYEAALAKARR